MELLPKHTNYRFPGFCEEAKRVAVSVFFSDFLNFLLAHPKNPHLTKKKLKKTVQQVVLIPSEGRLKKKTKKKDNTIHYNTETEQTNKKQNQKLGAKTTKKEQTQKYPRSLIDQLLFTISSMPTMPTRDGASRYGDLRASHCCHP